MAESLQAILGTEHLFFHDAIAPIVSAESLDMTRIFEGSRYGAGSDYLNCPMTEEEYDGFVQALLSAELHPIRSFDKPPAEDEIQGDSPRRDSPRISSPFFEGCLPVEEIARRGRLALAFGPMKPVGLVDPRTGKRPFAVVQLRLENADGSMYNLVGFQTRLKQGEQERVFRMIPGLEKVTFLRFGSIHRNTFLDSPKVLLPTLQARASSDLLVAGQLAGVEGYVESIGAGLVAGINAARLARGEESVELPREMMMGSLLAYIATPGGLGHDPDSSKGVGSCPARRFQPMNANFGLLPPISGDSPPKRLRGRDKRRALAERALEAARGFALTAAENRG
jgi:methylenetetrahydrofolate--tRNA-(uracil-5-)-methyltransferase